MIHPNSISRVKLIAILSLFAIIYCLISFPNHYLLRTDALDLGMLNHALYNFAHFDINYFTLSYDGSSVNYFGDHFSPITILYAPFYYLFGSYTLLIIQIFAILFGAVGLFRYARYKLPHINDYKLLIVIQFLSIWGIYSALSFDFHNNVIGAMMVPWLFLYYDKQKNIKFLLFFVLILATKENMSLWLFFIVLGIIIKERNFNFRKLLKFEIPILIFTIVYFVVVVGLLMPWFREGNGFDQLSRYELLGNNLSEIIATLFTRPGYVLSLLYENTTGNPTYDGIKAELHMMVIVSGGFLFILRPYYIIMLIPIYAQKMFSNQFGTWGINVQYSIEFAPIISLCVIDFFSSIKKSKYIILGLVLICASTIFYTHKTLENRKSKWYKRQNSVFHKKEHYETPFDVKNIYDQIFKIPKNITVSASGNLSPHLAFRDQVYLFPKIGDSEFVALLKTDKTYPLTPERYYELIEKLKRNKKYKIWYENEELVIFKKVVQELIYKK
jgi:uncharacterized membrane protein